MRKSRIYKLILLIMLFTFNANAQNVRFSASVNKNNITDKDVLIYTINIEGVSDFPNVSPPESPDFVLISGPSQSSSIQIINGQMTASKTISWQIAPTRTGQLTIKPISIKYRGKTYTTDLVTVNVTSASSGQQKPSTPPSGATRPAPGASTDSRREEVFLKATVPQQTVYKGQELVVTFDLYYRNVRTFGRKKLPDARGFWIEEFPAPSQPTITNETINGVPYRKATIQQIALFATTTGELTIDPMVIDCEVVQPSQRRRSIFDDFFEDSFFNDPFFSGTKVVTIESAPLKIQVKPLPEKGKPSAFNGAVGSFKIESSIDNPQVKQDQALTLRYKISGNGNINALKLTPLILPNSVEVFEPKIDKIINKSGGTIGGSVTYEYVLIPRRPGQLTIPALQFAYFDPQTEAYRTLTTRSFNLKIDVDESARSDRSVGLSKTEISLLGQDIRFIMRENTGWRKLNHTVFSEIWFWLLNGISLSILLGAVGLRWWTDKLQSNLAFARRRQAWPRWQTRLRSMQTMLVEAKEEEFFTQLDQAIIGYIADRLVLPIAGLGPREIEQALNQCGIEAELLQKVLSLLKRLNEIRFLPGLAADAEPRTLLTESREIINNLSKVI
ncbi:MAG: BatD family protein [Candidatus Marinimicrobia bacterium]|nr:BatD family protein [Candidatus Neomarinimicrobiota bacterium]MCK9483220.1 BatD family protein [Candidatus Neomarinimicrobiota bacterium]MDD5060806.1 BatD family protein [Candidatus Neomarinimicrobiota bacterium]